MIGSLQSRYYLFFVTLFYINCSLLSFVGPVIPGEPLWGITRRVASTADVIESRVEACADTPLFIPTTITEGGIYCLANDIPGALTIAASDVDLDLNNYKVTEGISVDSGLNRITIKNGKVEGTADAIVVNGGTNDVTIKDVLVKSAIRGIHLNNVNGAVIDNCQMSMNTTGVELDNCHNVVIDHSVAMSNTHAGFCLLSSTTCCILDSKALSTGDGNTDTSGNIFGFVSIEGNANVFERCIANGTQGLQLTDYNSVVVGIGLRGAESGSKIIDCESANGAASQNGFTIPYGIYLEATINGDLSVTGAPEIPAAGSLAVTEWSPNSEYVALGGAAATLSLYRFDRTTSILSRVSVSDPATFTTFIDWHPSGIYIASTISGADVSLYSFDPRNCTLVRKAVITGPFTRAVWDSAGKFLATLSATELRVYSFDILAQTFTLVDTLAGLSATSGLDWASDRRFIAVGTTSSVSVYRFEGSSLGLCDTISVTNTGNVAWSPDTQYLATTQLAGGLENLLIYSFDGLSLTLVETGANFVEEHVRWTADGRYLVDGNPRVIRFDRTTNTATEVAASIISYGAQVPGVSPDGQYISLPDTSGALLFELYSLPSGNVVTGNTVYCNKGRTGYGGGVSGSSIANMIVSNTAYNNFINYTFVTNVFNDLFGQVPTIFQNISIRGREPTPPPEDIGLLINQAVISIGGTTTLLDEVLDKVCNDIPSQLETIDSKIDALTFSTTDDLCAPTPITSANISAGTITLSASGNYCLVEDVTANVSITGDCINFDLNNRCVTGVVSITGDDVELVNGNVKPPAPTAAPTAALTIAATAERTLASGLIIENADSGGTGVDGRDGIEILGNDSQLVNCTALAGAASSGGTGGIGGVGLIVGTTANNAIITSCILKSGNGGDSSTMDVDGGAAGDGISIQGAATETEINNCTIISTGMGGDATSGNADGGNGGHGVFIASTAVDTVVRACTIRNTGEGGLESGSGTAGVAGKAVDDDVIIVANLSMLYSNFGHNIANNIKFDLQGTGLEQGVAVANPPTATVVNSFANIFVS